MSKEIVVANRYADALFQLAEEKSTIDTYINDFQVVREVFLSNTELNSFLLHPRVTLEQKEKLVVESFTGLHVDVVNTIKLLLQRHRTALIPAIVDAFIKKANDAKGIEVATVYSVRELTPNEKANLKKSFVERLSKSSLQFENIVDPSLIGGVKIRVGNTIYDGSVSGKIERIQREITSAKI